MNFYDEFISKKQDILIPSIQRDYVQGSNRNLAKGIIQSFLGKLISAVKGNESIDLTYIYGYNDNNCFVPIDGQQRLTTLWLLYAYIYTLNGQAIPIKLKYESREFAQDFLEILPEHLTNMFTTKQVIDLKQEILDSPWYISSWNKDLTVESCINTLNEVHKLVYKNEDAKILLDGIKSNYISFSFYRLERKMNADTYIKMNGRGRSLTDFENLKSWLDDFVEKNSSTDFCLEWKQKMDNEWAAMFWANRNKSQEHPEEIDDEQLRYFYNMLYIYWMKQVSPKFNINEEERCRMAEILEIRDPYTIEDVVLEHIKRPHSYGYSLYILESLRLVNADFIYFFNKATDAICANYKQINILGDRVANMWRTVNDQISLTYSIFFDSESEPTYTTLVLASALIFYMFKYEKQCEHMEDWLRVWRNLTENHDINNSNINNILQKTDDFIKSSEEDILHSIRTQDPQLPFPKRLLDEEIEKAKKIAYDGWKEKIYTAENYAFFRGRIPFLFTDEESEIDWSFFDQKFKNVQLYFDKNGVTEDYRSVLMCNLIALFTRWEMFWGIRFDNTSESWRNILLGRKWTGPIHCLLLSNYNQIMPTSIKDSELSELQKQVQRDLALTGLLTKIGSKFELGWKFDNYYIAPKNSHYYTPRFIIIGNQRNSVLQDLHDCIHTDQFIRDTPFYWGRDISFVYQRNNQKYNLKWLYNNRIILCNENWEEQDLYIDVHNMSSEQIRVGLNDLCSSPLLSSIL